jgi:hypothetical protein
LRIRVVYRYEAGYGMYIIVGTGQGTMVCCSGLLHMSREGRL